MNVRKLIKELSKYPGNMEVVFKDHDHSELEFNDVIRYVTECEIKKDDEIKNVIALSGM